MFENNYYRAVVWVLHHTNHWSVLVMFPQTYSPENVTVYHYNSLPGARYTYNAEQMIINCKKMGILPVNARLDNVTGLPVQKDATSCGYFAIQYVYLIARHTKNSCDRPQPSIFKCLATQERVVQHCKTIKRFFTCMHHVLRIPSIQECRMFHAFKHFPQRSPEFAWPTYLYRFFFQWIQKRADWPLVKVSWTDAQCILIIVYGDLEGMRVEYQFDMDFVYKKDINWKTYYKEWIQTMSNVIMLTVFIWHHQRLPTKDEQIYLCSVKGGCTHQWLIGLFVGDITWSRFRLDD